jgi:hypothetical protein
MVMSGDLPDSTEALMQPWFDYEYGELMGQPSVKGDGIVMGYPLWGKEFIERFLVYTIPTLMAPANLEALSGRCRLVLYHERAAGPMLDKHLGWVRRSGIELILRRIPDDVMEMLYRRGPPVLLKTGQVVPGNYSARFQALSVVGNVLVRMAGRWGMAFHMSQPDHLYGPNYFPNLFRLGEKYEAITQMSLNATMAIAPELEKFRTNSGGLIIPDRELGDMGFRHMHPQCQLHSMNAAKIPDKIPLSHRLFWQGKDAVHMYSSHVNAAWLSPRLCADAPIAFTSTLDTLLPELIPPDVEVYIPTPEDEMTFIEFSDADKPANRPYVPMDEFCTNFWDSSSFSGEYIPYFIRPTRIPIKPKASYLTDDEITRQFGTLLEAVMESQDRVGIQWLKKRFQSRYTRAANLPEVAR